MSVAEVEAAPEKPQVLAPIPDGIPRSLKLLPQWLVWKLECRDGKWTKVPYNAKTGDKAASDDESTWSDYKTAWKAYGWGKCGFDGIGFVFKKDSGLAGLDLDDCYDGEAVKPWAKEIAQSIPSYGEDSPSGRGAKFFCEAKLTIKQQTGTRKPVFDEAGNKVGSIEIYTHGRFFTVTGRVAGKHDEIGEASAELQAVYDKISEPKRPKANGKPKAPKPVPDATDDAIIEKAKSSKIAAKFSSLWSGDISAYGSQSEADLALCSLLAFWAGPDESRIDRLFRQSGLVRDKWTEREDYRRETIAKAIDGCRKFYDWNRSAAKANRKASREVHVASGGSESSNNTDVGNGRRLAAEAEGNFRYCHPWKTWYVYRKGSWQPDESGAIDRLAKATIKRMYQKAADMPDRHMREAMFKHALASENVARIVAMIKCAQSEPGIPIMPEDFDRDVDLFNFKNCTVDLRTGTARPHRREDYISKISPVEFVADAGVECPLWETVLHRVLDGDASLISYTQRLLGYCCTGSTKEQILPIWHGEGQNGKSTILNIVLDILGDYGGKAAPELLLKKRMSHPTELADLFGKRLIVANETDDGSQFAEALAKDLTGSDRIKARKMFKDFFQFTPTHKIVVATNHPPRVKGTDFAFWRRVKLSPFSVVIPEDEKDPDLPKKLKAELSGIARWLVEGCLAWRRQGLLVPEAVTKATAAYRKQEDTFGNFLEAYCVVGQGYNAPATKLLDAYVDFSGDKEMNKTQFAQILAKKGFTSDRYTAGPNKGRIGWWGLGLVAFEHAGGED